jgi:hypothetical protein
VLVPRNIRCTTRLCLQWRSVTLLLAVPGVTVVPGLVCLTSYIDVCVGYGRRRRRVFASFGRLGGGIGGICNLRLLLLLMLLLLLRPRPDG